MASAEPIITIETNRRALRHVYTLYDMFTYYTVVGRQKSAFSRVASIKVLLFELLSVLLTNVYLYVDHGQQS